MQLDLKAKAENRPVWRATPFLQVLVLLMGFLSGCATTPMEIYHGYSAIDLRERSIATVELVDADWAKFNELHVDGRKYNAVKLLPGSYRVEYSRTFSRSFVNPKMLVSHAVNATVKLEAGGTYRLRADRTFGPEFTMYFWIEDAEGNIIHHSGRVEQSDSVPSELRIADPYIFNR